MFWNSMSKRAEAFAFVGTRGRGFANLRQQGGLLFINEFIEKRTFFNPGKGIPWRSCFPWLLNCMSTAVTKQFSATATLAIRALLRGCAKRWQRGPVLNLSQRFSKLDFLNSKLARKLSIFITKSLRKKLIFNPGKGIPWRSCFPWLLNCAPTAVTKHLFATLAALVGALLLYVWKFDEQKGVRHSHLMELDEHTGWDIRDFCNSMKKRAEAFVFVGTRWANGQRHPSCM